MGRRHFKLSRLGYYGERLTESQGFLSVITMVLVFLAATRWIYDSFHFLIITHVYGSAAWMEGLRVIDKRGNLSNGDFLSGWSCVLLYFGTFVLSAPLAIGSSFLVTYLRLHWQGRRLSDPKPKKNWLSSGKCNRTG